MRSIRLALGTLLALAWVLASSHCKIGAIEGFEFLQCATEVHEHADSEHAGDPCDEAGCCAFETVQHHAPRPVDVPPAVLHEVIALGSVLVLERGLAREATGGILTAAPPELPQSWQFLARTALPVRAPSFAS